MNFEFMTIDTPLPPCMPFPRALTGFPVSSTAKVMYCRMLDAMLSKGQEDENGILFVCFPVTAIAAVLSRSPMTVKRSLNELETAGLMLDNIESEYPGYDEYRVNADEIEHDPYVLISILSAWHEGVFTLDEVQSTLEMLFEKQYILTVEEEVQVRYRTETRTDSEGNPYTVEVPYNYYILHVDLENFNLSHVPVYIMGEEQLSMYAMYMSSLGNRPDLFPQSGYVSKYYENPPADYEVPAALLGSDEKFARLMEEADKYVGFPYVWGGSTPETSFDCSGFVSYVLTNSGLYNTGRLGAQGLYNISTPVSNPQPGDLVFFTGTYDTPGVSHVGIYVGEDGDGSPVMLHCGDPIQYSKLDTSYWQSHFYAYGRLNYN